MKFLAALLFLCISNAAYSQCAIPQQDGTFVFTADTSAACAGYWLIPATEYTAYLSSVEITASELTEAFLWGFGVVVTFSALGYSVGVARSLVNKL